MGAIADMIRAGVDPDLVERVAMEMVETARHGLPVRTARQERNARYYDNRKRLKASESVLIETDLSPKVSPQRDINHPPLPNPLSKPKRAKAKTAISADQQPTAADLETARAAGVPSIRDEWQAFRDHHISRGNLMSDWSAAWRTWVRNSKKFSARAGPSQQQRPRVTSLTALALGNSDEPDYHNPDRPSHSAIAGGIGFDRASFDRPDPQFGRQEVGDCGIEIFPPRRAAGA